VPNLTTEDRCGLKAVTVYCVGAVTASNIGVIVYTKSSQVIQCPSSILVGHSIGHSQQKVYMYMCPIPSRFRDEAISLYSFKIVDKKDTLRTVSNLLFK
jgi:hypothetical protein